MTRFFYKNTHQFSVKKTIEPLLPDEAIIQFRNKQEIHNFFSNATKTQMNLPAIQQIAEDISPTFSQRHLKNQPQLSNQERMDFLFSELEKGNARVILKNESIKTKPETTTSPKNEYKNNTLFNFDITKFVKNQVEHLKKVYAKIIPADFSLIETVYQYDENSSGPVPITLDLSTIEEHSTGWKDWDDPFEYGMLGVAKALLVFDLAMATKLSQSKFLAAASGYILEGIKCQYNIVGKSIICRKWYGSFSIRFNLKSWQPEIAWVKYKHSGQNERLLFDLKRADRMLKDKKVLFTLPANDICPVLSGDDLLTEYKKGVVPPEKNVTKPIPLK